MTRLTKQARLEIGLMDICDHLQNQFGINHDVDDLSLPFIMHALPPPNHEWMSLEEG